MSVTPGTRTSTRFIRLSAAALGLTLLTGCLEEQPFGRLDRSKLAIAARAPSLRGDKGAALLVRITKNGRGCGIGRARVRTLVSAINGGAAYTIGQKRILERDPAELALAAQMRDLFGVDTVPKRHARVRNADVAYVSIPPGEYIVTRIECEQDGRVYTMGADYGDEAPPPGEVFRPVKGQNMIAIKAGEIVDAGVLDIVDRERGLFKTRSDLVASPTPDAYRAMIQAELPDVASQTVYRSFTRFSACETAKGLAGDAGQVAEICAKEAAEAAIGQPDQAEADGVDPDQAGAERDQAAAE